MSARFRGVGFIAAIAIAAAFAWACSDDEAPPPGAEPGDDGGAKEAASPADGNAGGNDTGTPKDTGGPEPEENEFCADAGAAFVDGGTCDVSFKDDVLPLLQVCVGCHDGRNPRWESDTPAEQVWRTFAKYEGNKGHRFINPCSKDVLESFIVPTLDPDNDAGAKVMPPGTGLAAPARATVQQWVECGAPNN